MKTWSFMIFVFHLYSAEPFGIWDDADHYICIWSFLVVLVNWTSLSYAMMTYFSPPTIQSCFVCFTTICKKLCCRTFVLLCNCDVLWFAPSALLCGFLWFDLCLLLLTSCNPCALFLLLVLCFYMCLCCVPNGARCLCLIVATLYFDTIVCYFCFSSTHSWCVSLY